MKLRQESESQWKCTALTYLCNIHWPLIHPVIHSSIHARRLSYWNQWLEAAVTQTDLGGQVAANGPSSRHICYTRWSRAAGRRPPAPTPGRWSAPPCSRRTAAWPRAGGSQPVKQGSGAPGPLRQRSNSGWRWGDCAVLTERRHPAARVKWRRSRDAWIRGLG